MKAIKYTRYGSPEVLQLVDKPTPSPGKGEVLVRVKAASINSWDYDMIRGKPWFVRLWGVIKPKFTIPGADIAGIVEAVGSGVTKFKPGDEVFGDLNECGWGGFAEYVAAREDAVFLKPPQLSFEEASSLPQAGLMALQSIRDKGAVRHGHSVLINGAGGGVGTFGIQLAKLFGAEVTAIDKGPKLDALKKLGADHVIDYTNYDYTKGGKTYDVIIDVVADKSLSDYKRVLNPHGQFIMIGGIPSTTVMAIVFGPWASRGGTRTVGMLAYRTNRGLLDLASLCSDGIINPVIDRTFPLEETREAIRYFGTAAFIGKVVITM